MQTKYTNLRHLLPTRDDRIELSTWTAASFQIPNKNHNKPSLAFNVVQARTLCTQDMPAMNHALIRD